MRPGTGREAGLGRAGSGAPGTRGVGALPDGVTESGCATFARRWALQHLDRLAKQVIGFAMGDRRAEQVTLYLIALLGIQQIQLLRCLNTFRDDLEPHVVGHCDDGADDGRIILIRGDIADKGTVDLDGVDREAL